MGRLRTWLLLLAWCWLWLAPPALAAPRTDPDDALLLDVRTSRLTLDRTVGAFTTADGLCIAFHDLIDVLQLAIRVDVGNQTARGWALEENRRIEIDRAKGIASFGDQMELLGSNAIWDTPGGWCVQARYLERWLGLKFDADINNAILTVSAKNGLPIEAAFRRQQSAERLNSRVREQTRALPTVTLPYRLWRDPVIDMTATSDIDRGNVGRAQVRGRYEGFAAGEIGFLSADSRISSDNRGIPRSVRVKLYRDDHRGRLLGPLKATEFALGDVMSVSSPLATSATPGRGIKLSNQPLGTSDRVDRVDFRGPMPQGWDVELYRNGELIRSTTAATNGRYDFSDIDLRLGPNDFELVQYGPQGQVRRERQSYQIGAQIPARGETWWHFNILDGQRELFEFSRGPPTPTGRGWRVDTGFETGLAPGSSLALGLHSLNLTGGKRVQLIEGSTRAALFGNIVEFGLVTDASEGSAMRAKLLGALDRTNFALEVTRSRSLTTERLDPGQLSVVQLSVDRPIQAGTMLLPVRFDLRALTTRTERQLQAQTRVSLATRRFTASATLGLDHYAPVDGPNRTELAAQLLFNGRIGKVRVRGETRLRAVHGVRLEDAAITANYSRSARDEFIGTIGHNGTERSSYVGLGYTRDLGFAALTLNGQLGTRGAFAAGVSLQFSIGNGDNGRFGRIRSETQTGVGRIAVTAYRDNNADGVRQPDEPLIRPPGLTVNRSPMGGTDAENEPAPKEIVLEGFAPAVPVEISLNESSLADPFDMPASKGVAAIPRAGLVTRVELGIVGTAALEGRLFANGREAPGEALELVDAKGEVAYRMRTEFDGVFSLERVRYGSYRLRHARSGGDLLGRTIEVNPRASSIALGRIELGSGALTMMPP